MIVVKGNPPTDVFDTVYQNIASTGGWGNDYSATINNTQVWARMTNSPYGENFVVRNPQPGTYYMIVQTSDTGSNNLQMGVSGK